MRTPKCSVFCGSKVGGAHGHRRFMFCVVYLSHRIDLVGFTSLTRVTAFNRVLMGFWSAQTNHELGEIVEHRNCRHIARSLWDSKNLVRGFRRCSQPLSVTLSLGTDFATHHGRWLRQRLCRPMYLMGETTAGTNMDVVPPSEGNLGFEVALFSVD